MDSKPKRQLTDQQRANLAAGREKLKTLRADPEYVKGQKERRESRKQEQASQVEAGPVRASSRSRSRVAPDAATSKSSRGSSEYAASVPTL